MYFCNPQNPNSKILDVNHSSRCLLNSAYYHLPQSLISNTKPLITNYLPILHIFVPSLSLLAQFYPTSHTRFAFSFLICWCFQLIWRKPAIMTWTTQSHYEQLTCDWARWEACDLCHGVSEGVKGWLNFGRKLSAALIFGDGQNF